MHFHWPVELSLSFENSFAFSSAASFARYKISDFSPTQCSSSLLLHQTRTKNGQTHRSEVFCQIIWIPGEHVGAVGDVPQVHGWFVPQALRECSQPCCPWHSHGFPLRGHLQGIPCPTSSCFCQGTLLVNSNYAVSSFQRDTASSGTKWSLLRKVSASQPYHFLSLGINK